MLLTPKQIVSRIIYFGTGEGLYTSSFRLLRRATSIVAPGAGLVESIENYSDFRKVDGIEIPFKRTGSQVGSGEFTTTITDLKFNARIADSEFRKK